MINKVFPACKVRLEIDKVVSKLVVTGKQNAIITSDSSYGGVPELVDGHDLGSCVERRGGSSPPFPTIVNNRGNYTSLVDQLTFGHW